MNVNVDWRYQPTDVLTSRWPDCTRESFYISLNALQNKIGPIYNEQFGDAILSGSSNPIGCLKAFEPSETTKNTN